MDTLILFRYIHSDSLLHRTDPRVKLFALILTTITVGYGSGITVGIVAILSLAVLLRIAPSPRVIFSQLRLVIGFLLMVFLLSFFLYGDRGSLHAVTPAEVSGLNEIGCRDYPAGPLSGFHEIGCRDYPARCRFSGRACPEGAVQGSPSWDWAWPEVTFTLPGSFSWDWAWPGGALSAFACPGVVFSGFPFPVLSASGWAVPFYRSMLLTARLGAFFLLGLLLTTSTSIRELRQAIVTLLKPIPWVPAATIGLMISLTVGLLPLLHEQVTQIRQAQLARGVDSRRRPLHSLRTLVLPVLILTFRRTEEIADAMEARCYAPREAGLTRKLRKTDVIFLAGVVLFSCANLLWL